MRSAHRCMTMWPHRCRGGERTDSVSRGRSERRDACVCLVVCACVCGCLGGVAHSVGLVWALAVGVPARGCVSLGRGAPGALVWTVTPDAMHRMCGMERKSN